jgi:hypothetical protein
LGYQPVRVGWPRRQRSWRNRGREHHDAVRLLWFAGPVGLSCRFLGKFLVSITVVEGIFLLIFILKYLLLYADIQKEV